MLELRDIHSGYGDMRVLHGVSLAVREGEIVSVIGANGAGKSTLIRTVMGSVPVSSGDVRFLGERIAGRPPFEIARLGIAQVMEGRRLFPHMTVEENLLVGGDILGDAGRSRANLRRIYAMFPRLAERQGQLARSFSGGEQQMLAIGRALMTSPRLLLLDEPSIGLAPVVVKSIFGVLREIREQGITILLVEQDVHRSLSLATRAYVIKEGSIVKAGPSETLLADSELKRSYLGI